MEHPSGPAYRGVVTWQRLLLIASLLTFWSLPTTAKQVFKIPVESAPPIAGEGKEVLLLASKLPEMYICSDWFRGEVLPVNNIVTLRPNPENIINGPAYSGRETLYSNGSLLIRNLSVRDKGIYCIQVFTVSGDVKYGYGDLRVYESLPKPHITANNSSPLEQEDSVVLTCEPKSPYTAYQWFNNTWPIQPSTRLQLSPDNSTLTVLHVTRKDTGPYECETSNPVNVHRSDPFTLHISYGPNVPIFFPSKHDYRQGEHLRLSCLTASYPPAQFSWFMDENPLGSTQTLSIPNLSLNNSGSYSCLTRNSVTRLNRTASIRITVSKPVAPPSIQATHSTVTEGAGPVVLTCLTNDTGVSTQWYLNDKDMQPAERRKLSADNRTLILQPIMMADGGDYQCEVSNLISSNRSDQIRLQVTSGGGSVPVGIIVGTVFGVLVGVGLVAVLGYFLFHRRSKRNQVHHDHIEQKPPTNSPGSGAPSSSAFQTQAPLPDQNPAVHIYETLHTPDSSLYCRAPPKAP